jgi:hypothetical protein
MLLFPTEAMGGGDWAVVMTARVDRIIDEKRVGYWGSARFGIKEQKGTPLG